MIVAYQARQASDALFKPAIRFLFRMHGGLWFAFAASGSSYKTLTDALEGRLFIFKSKEDWLLVRESGFTADLAAINRLRPESGKERDTAVEKHFDACCKTLQQNADIHLDFVLFRNGEVFFSLPSYADADLKYASDYHAETEGYDFSKWVADQAYFFLRDLSHVHQHHAPSSDTILVLQERDEDETKWRNNLLYSLHHYVVRARRHGEACALHQAAGILSYCMAFSRISMRRLGQKSSKLADFDDASLMLSIKARAEEAAARQAQYAIDAQQRVSRAGTNRSLCLAMVAIAISFLLVFVQPYLQSDPHFKTLSVLIVGNFWRLFLALSLATVFVWASTQRSWRPRPVTRDFYELAVVRPKLMAGAAALAAITLVTTIVATIGRSAWVDILTALKSILGALP